MELLIDKGYLTNFSFNKILLKEDAKDIDIPVEIRDSNYYWRKDKIKSYHYIIEFDEIIILSRIIFQKPSKIKFQYYLSLEKNGDYIIMENEIMCQKGAIKMLDFHYFPCKYVHFITLNNENFPSKENIQCYGFNRDTFRNKYGNNMLEIIMNKTSKIIYHDKEKDDKE